jgi:hypothetical protein
VFGNRDGLEYTGELAFQAGNANNERLSASAFALTARYTVEETEWKPGVRAELAFAQGDSNPGDGRLKTFQTVFPTNHMHYGYADLVGWNNIWDLVAGVYAKPTDQLRFLMDFHYFQLHHPEGGWFNAAGQQLRNGDPNASDRLGTELDLIAQWHPETAFTLQGGWGRFFPGSFVRDTGSAKVADFLYIQAQLRF